MENQANLSKVLEYFRQKFNAHGSTPQGVDWNSIPSQVIRFEQVLKVCDFSSPFSLIDYGCGYGSLVDYLEALEVSFTYQGYDPLPEMIESARHNHAGKSSCKFTTHRNDLSPATFLVASGIFNVKLDSSNQAWTDHVLETLDDMNRLSINGFSFNCLTVYSDAERMRPDLYYADPCFLFDHCKTHYARNVALLHDYNLYDFTILVRKETA